MSYDVPSPTTYLFKKTSANVEVLVHWKFLSSACWVRILVLKWANDPIILEVLLGYFPNLEFALLIMVDAVAKLTDESVLYKAVAYPFQFSDIVSPFYWANVYFLRLSKRGILQSKRNINKYTVCILDLYYLPCLYIYITTFLGK